ncbi:MAG: hypothetical protein PHE97_07170 [Candidatus Omnitrophica bacterium]|nr:hypothetical protein [Candidatus Omnitrophota bacterium]
MVERINITIPAKFKKEVDTYLKKMDVTRSKFFIIAAYQYMKELEKKKIRQELEEGYEQMSSVSDQIANDSYSIQRRIVNDI